MSQLTKNIWRKELTCKCSCGFDTMDWETIEVVQECCDHFASVLGFPKVTCIIHSAARCRKHNAAVDGGENSQHLYGRAIDFRIRGVAPIDVLKYLHNKYPYIYGLGDYGSFTHIDTRTGGPARWGGL